jgi:UTP--glucose-1-phosphate uridylyltransferase
MITKGVILAAGKGTRFLPVTKSIPKEMLPIVDKPIIHYVVQEMVEAGIKDIIIVTSWDHRAIEDYFDHTKELEEYLKERGKTELLKEIASLAEMANFIYVRQKGPYGNGTPCLNVETIIGNEPFVYAFGDDLVLAGESFTKQMVREYRKKPGIYFGVQEVSKEDVVRYGIIKPRDNGNNREVECIVEKPKINAAPSRLAEFGRFILPPDIFQSLKETSLGLNNELWLVDAIEKLIEKGQKAYYKEVEDGRWYTTGDPVNYFEAVRAYALVHPEIGEKVGHIFKNNIQLPKKLLKKNNKKDT